MMSGTQTLLTIVLVLALGFSLYIAVGKYEPVISDGGKETPYFVRGKLGKDVYFRKWSGDGLGGSYIYSKLNGVSRDDFRVVDHVVEVVGDWTLANQDVETGDVPVGIAGTRGFHFGRELPFSMNGQETLTRIYRTTHGPAAVSSQSKVYFWRGDSYPPDIAIDAGSLKRYKAASIEGVDDVSMLDFGNYFGDNKQVIYADSLRGHVIHGADPATFKVLGSYGYATDQNFLYHYGKKIEGSDGSSVVSMTARIDEDPKQALVETGYVRDLKHVYYLGKVVEGADPKTFVAKWNSPPTVANKSSLADH